MARFTTRIELINSDEYDILHAEMDAEGFTRTITDTNTGIEYYLPRAEYNYEGNLTREQVMSKAKNAASKTGERYRILVTPTPARIWHNLERVSK